MTKKTQQKQLDDLLTDIRIGLDEIIGYYMTSEDYVNIAKELIYRLDEYENSLKSKP